MIEDLTNKEKIVMNMLIQGQSSQAIIEWLCIDYHCYSNIRKSLLKKLNANRITQLIKIAIKNKYII